MYNEWCFLYFFYTLRQYLNWYFRSLFSTKNHPNLIGAELIVMHRCIVGADLISAQDHLGLRLFQRRLFGCKTISAPDYLSVSVKVRLALDQTQVRFSLGARLVLAYDQVKLGSGHLTLGNYNLTLTWKQSYEN